MKKDAVLTLIGFLLFIIGFMSVFLGLIGLNFKFLAVVNNTLGSSGAFLLHIIMIMAGLITIYIAKQKTSTQV